MEKMETEKSIPRDLKMDANYFEDMLTWYSATIESNIAHIKRTEPKDPQYRAQFVFENFILHFERLIMSYSNGLVPEKIVPLFLPLLDAWEWSLHEEKKVFNDTEMAARKRFSQNLDFYVVCLWLVSLAICLELDDASFKRLLDLCDNEGEDWLFEHLVSSRVSGRKEAIVVRYPKM